MQSPDVRMVTEAAQAVKIKTETDPLKATDAAHDQRLDDLEVLGGLTPGDVNDATTASLIRNTSSETNSELTAAIRSGAVTSPQVARIIVISEGEPAPTMVNGDMLVRFTPPGSIYYKDFALDTQDLAPSGITKLLADTAAVKNYSEGTGGRVLLTPTIGVAAYGITAAEGDDHYTEAEILVRWQKGGAGTHGLNIFFNVDSASDSFDRIGYINTGHVRWTVRRDGVNVTVPESPCPVLPDNTWCMIRARMAGGFISGKVWVDGAPEPSAYQFSRAVGEFQPVLPPGPHGVGTVNTSTRIDHITHATGGKVAVKP